MLVIVEGGCSGFLIVCRCFVFVFLVVGADGQECVGEHGEGDVPVPGVVEPYLVVVESDAAFC